MLQQKWLFKLLGLDYTILYKKGSENKLRQFEEGEAMEHYAIIMVNPTWMNEVMKTYEGDEWATFKITSLLIKGDAIPSFTITQGLLKNEGKLYIRTNGLLREQILTEMCDNHLRDTLYSSYLQKSLYLLLLASDEVNITRLVQNLTHAKDKSLSQFIGLLQPLLIPKQASIDKSMNFIEGQPNSQGFDFILVVVNRFSKYNHFIALKHPFNATHVAQLFFWIMCTSFGNQVATLHCISTLKLMDRQRGLTDACEIPKH